MVLMGFIGFWASSVKHPEVCGNERLTPLPTTCQLIKPSDGESRAGIRCWLAPFTGGWGKYS